MKLNKKGFTLIEMLAVVIILSTLMAIMVPSVNYLIEKNKENNYNDVKNSILSAAKMYVSDYRYEIVIDDGICTEEEKNNNAKKNITSIGIGTDSGLTDSHLIIGKIVDNIKTNEDGEIINPKNTNQKLNLNDSYVLIQYNCKSKDYSYTLEENSLQWIAK